MSHDTDTRTGTDTDTDILIVGAGPVGLTLAMDLAARGLRATLVELRRFAEPPNVKCNHVSARSMEVFRRLGVAAALRGAGLPAEHPNDVVFRTSLTGIELTRIPIPCRRDRYTDTSGPDGWWPTPEPPHRINQLYLEPILLRHAASRPGVTLHNRSQLVGYQQDDTGVEAELLDLDSGATRRLRARYLVGCDGGSSTVRRLMGARLEGTAVIQRVQSAYIRAPGLAALMAAAGHPPAWGHYSVNPRRCGTVFAIDGHETWLVHNHLNAHEPEFDSVDRDWAIRQILGVDEHFAYEVISREDWVGRRLVATQFRSGRIFIAGDAAHLWVPYAGYGMNAGIADAVNLSWHLSAQLHGWADPAALDAYEYERQPITEQVSQFAMNHAQAMIKARSAVSPRIEEPGPEGDAIRAAAGREAFDLNVQQFCCAGLNFGYFYEHSPLIAYGGDGVGGGGEDAGEAAPAYSMGSFVASTVPGCRAPHLWLRDGRSLYDAFGPDYTLLRTHPEADAGPLLAAAQARGVPLQLLDLSGEAAALPPEYRHRLLICRPDQHVAWRGDEAPAGADALVLMDRLRGVVAAG